MAAALFRRGTGLSCMHRELCRVVWRPQTALFTSKPPEKNQQPPRRTHIKTAVKQPTVDVAKLLEQLETTMESSPMEHTLSHPMEHTLPHPMEHTLSHPVEHTLSHPMEHTLPHPMEHTLSHPVEHTLPQPVEHTLPHPLEHTLPQPVEHTLSQPVEHTLSHPVEHTLPHPMEHTLSHPVEHTLPQPVEHTLPQPAEHTLPHPLEHTLPHPVEHTLSQPVEHTLPNFTVGTLETRDAAAVEGPVEPPIDVAAQKVETKSTNSGPVNLSHAAPVTLRNEPAKVPPVESVKAAVEEEGNRCEEMALSSVTFHVDRVMVASFEDDELLQTISVLDEQAERQARELLVRTEMGAESSSEDERAGEGEDERQSLTEVLSKWDSLSEDLQELEGESVKLLFNAPPETATGAEAAALESVTLEEVGGLEAVRANTSDATVAAGSVDVDAAPEVTDDLKEVLPEEEEEVEEERAQAGISGIEDGHERREDLDPVQRLFLEKIKEYNNMRRLNGGPLEAEPDYERYVSEETAKLRRLHGGGDLSSFPQFTFTEPQWDQDTK